MFKRVIPLIALLLCLPCFALAAEADFTVFPSLVRPGKTERISFTANVSGQAELGLCLPNGEQVAVIRAGMAVATGENHLTWNGRDAKGQDIPAGDYLLSLTLREDTVTQPITVGEKSPQITSIRADDSFTLGESWHFSISANMPGTLTLQIRPSDGQWHTFFSQAIPSGESAHTWNGILSDDVSLAQGTYPVQIKLTDAGGFSSTNQQISLSIVSLPTPTPPPTPTPAPTQRVIIPSAVTNRETEGLNYWTMQVGEMNEADIWEVMMQPMVVIDGDQKTQYLLRKTPDNSTKRENVVGEITCDSQGVHVLETRSDGWSYVEAFNSSYGDTYNKKGHRGFGNTDDLIRGYVKTSELKIVEPRTDYGLLIDKLEQKMYIFSDGKCIGTLLVSTGLNNAEQPWNETPAGEYFMISRSGGFPAGNLWCAYGMRVNDGTLIHEVPYIGNEDTPSSQRDYSSTVPQLGKKASHGCIRVQKAANEQGQNIKWLWDNIKVRTKVLIWDDTGRLVPYPADDTPLYYNPNNGQNYHEDQYCSHVKSRYLPLTAFTYGELDTGKYSKLTACKYCAKIMTKQQIDAMNKENGF